MADVETDVQLSDAKLSYYELLGLLDDATREAIEDAYLLAMMKVVPPIRAGVLDAGLYGDIPKQLSKLEDTELLEYACTADVLDEVYAVLSDEAKRADYDASPRLIELPPKIELTPGLVDVTRILIASFDPDTPPALVEAARREVPAAWRYLSTIEDEPYPARCAAAALDALVTGLRALREAPDAATRYSTWHTAAVVSSNRLTQDASSTLVDLIMEMPPATPLPTKRTSRFSRKKSANPRERALLVRRGYLTVNRAELAEAASRIQASCANDT